MKLSAWAKEQGVSYRAALNWFHAGTLPVPARQLPTGTILVDPPAKIAGTVVAYCRVSSHDQKADLERQAGRVLTLCSERGIRIDRTVTESGPGGAGGAPSYGRSSATRPWRPSWWSTATGWPASGWSTWKRPSRRTAAPWSSSTIPELPDDLARDLTEVLTSMCACLYGRRSAARRAASAVAAIENEPDEAPGDPA